MNKQVLTIVVFLLCAVLSTPTEAQFRLGPALSLSSSADFGLTAKADLMIQENISASPSVTIYFANLRDVVSVDLDGHYYIDLVEQLDLYAVGGLQLGFTSYNDSAVGNDTDIGLTVGGGLDYNITDNLDTFAESRHTFGGIGSFSIMAGIYFRIGG